MDRYYIALLVDEFKFNKHKMSKDAKNLKIHLYKEDQSFHKDLSDMFTNFSELDEESKVYASLFMDDLFSEDEILEMIAYFSEQKGMRVLIGSKVSFPMSYEKGSPTGMCIRPLDSSSGIFHFNKNFSFPLAAYYILEDSLFDSDTITKLLKEKGVPNEKIYKFLNDLLK